MGFASSGLSASVQAFRSRSGILNAALVAELDKGPDVLVVKFKRPFCEFAFL
jgi:hypothetical protein